jgi:peptidyl-prolyl cis-trans isomerase B (cyclophilin B)
MKTKIALIVMTFISIIGLSACVEKANAPSNSQINTINNNNSIMQNSVLKSDDSAPVTQEPTQAKAWSQTDAPVKGDKIAVIETDFGTIKMKLFDKLVPGMSTNFEQLANAGKYNNVPFHRVIKDFMIQTGDFSEKNGRGGYSYKGPNTTMPDEVVPQLKHLYGTVSMANKGPGTNSSGSQFFIVTNKKGVAYLDGGYSIFGQVYEGMDVAEKIVNLQIPGKDAPSEIVNMTKVTVTTY